MLCVYDRQYLYPFNMYLLYTADWGVTFGGLTNGYQGTESQKGTPSDAVNTITQGTLIIINTRAGR